MVTVPIFAKPNDWRRWARWAAQFCDQYSQIGEMLGVTRFAVWHFLQSIHVKVEPLGERAWVPVVWTEWGWLEGDFDDTGVFRYAVDEKTWENVETGSKG